MVIYGSNFSKLVTVFFQMSYAYHMTGSELFITAGNPVQKDWSVFALYNQIG